MAPFTFLDPPEEDKLHSTRLLPIEERPLKRLTSKLLGPKTPYQEFLRRRDPSSTTATTTTTTTTDDIEPLPDTPPPTPEETIASLTKFRTALLNEFSLFTTNLSRIQLLRAANEAERARYTAETLLVEAKADAVRDDISSLRTQLEQAQQTLAVRKTYDVLADRVTGDRRLRERGEQHVSIEKLKGEIEELEREGVELGQTWSERRTQLDSVVGEAQRLRRQIKNEKEPNPDGEDEDDDDESGDRARSNVGTPRPGEDDGGATPLPEARSGNATPMPEGMGIGTPRPDSGFLEVPDAVGGQAPTVEKAAVDEMDTS